jgi:hypothetical protein
MPSLKAWTGFSRCALGWHAAASAKTTATLAKRSGPRDVRYRKRTNEPAPVSGDRVWEKQTGRTKEGGRSGVLEIAWNEALRESACPEEAELAFFPGLPESLGMERKKKTAPTEAVGRRTDAGRDGKTEILAESLPLSFESN